MFESSLALGTMLPILTFSGEREIISLRYYAPNSVFKWLTPEDSE